MFYTRALTLRVSLRNFQAKHKIFDLHVGFNPDISRERPYEKFSG